MASKDVQICIVCGHLFTVSGEQLSWRTKCPYCYSKQHIVSPNAPWVNCPHCNTLCAPSAPTADWYIYFCPSCKKEFHAIVVNGVTTYGK